MTGLILFVFFALALLAPVLTRTTRPSSPAWPQEPDAEYWLGTTAKGQDVLALTI